MDLYVCLTLDIYITVIIATTTAVKFSQTQYSFKEGSGVEGGGGTLNVELTLSNPLPFEIIVYLLTDDITATGHNNNTCLPDSTRSDYLHGQYNVTFPANQVIEFVNIPICDDRVLEENETFSLTIVSNSNPNDVTNGSPDHAIITIIDDDDDCKFLLKK